METPDNIGCGLGRRYKTLRLNSGFTGSLGFISISTGYMHAACMKSSLNVPGFWPNVWIRGPIYCSPKHFGKRRLLGFRVPRCVTPLKIHIPYSLLEKCFMSSCWWRVFNNPRGRGGEPKVIIPRTTPGQLTIGGGNSNIFYVDPDPWGNDRIWRIFQMGWFNRQPVNILKAKKSHIHRIHGMLWVYMFT